jgi:predicted DCC family thiol-disulfide oxidoreductase YuxK
MPAVNTSTETDKMVVFYNGGCSICAPEVRYYERLAIDNDIPDIIFEDVSGQVALGQRDLIYLKRFHVQEKGTLYSGVDAFLILWRRLPRFSYLARFVALPGIYTIARMIYDRVLAPLLFARYQRQSKI